MVVAQYGFIFNLYFKLHIKYDPIIKALLKLNYTDLVSSLTVHYITEQELLISKYFQEQFIKAAITIRY